jgi:curved DNA-binding protein CbpA
MDLLPSGRLSNAKLPILIRYLRRNKNTGVLTVRRNDQERSIYLRGGDIIFATSKYPDDRLGEMLLKSGRITLDQYESSVGLLKPTGRRLGTILVEQGYITPKDLFTTVLSQVKEIILSLFTWIDGEYQFVEGNLPTDEVITLKMSTGDLILDGIKRIQDWTRLAKEIPPWDRTLQISTNPVDLFQQIHLLPQEQSFLKSIDGEKTVRDLFRNSPLPPLSTIQMIYFLLSVGIVEVVPETIKVAEAVKPAYVTEPQEIHSREKARAEAVIREAVLKEKRENVEDSQSEIFKKVAQEQLVDGEKIRQSYEAMAHQDHYQVLNLHREATRDEIKRAYFRLAKQYHPDRHLQEGMEKLHEHLEGLFRRITEAYDTLLIEKTRKEYDLSLAMGSVQQKKNQTSETQLSPDQQAIQLYDRAKAALKQGDMGQVVYCMEWVLRLGADKAIYHALLGQALAMTPGKLRAAEEAYIKAIHLEPTNPDYYIQLGLVYKKGGMKSRALAQFQEALKWNPEHKQAKAEIQSLK